MPEEKSKVQTDIKLVETPEVSDGVSGFPAPLESQSTSILAGTASDPACLPQMSPAAVSVFATQAPLLVFKQALFKGALFTGISLLLFAVPYLLLPGWHHSFNFPYIRTALVMLFTWNLIGAALYAHAQTRGARITAIALFGSPLAVGFLLLGIVGFLAPMLHDKYIGF